MRRIGPWVLVGGFVLLAAGIVSTSSDVWTHGELEPIERTADIDAQGVEVVRTGDMYVSKITVVDGPARLRYMERRPGSPATDVTWKLEGGVLSFDQPGERLYTRRVELDVPSSLRSVSGKYLPMHSDAPLESLQIEGSNVVWSGNARSLDIRLQAGVIADCGSTNQSNETEFEFRSGVVERIRLSAEIGRLRFKDLSHVGEVELNVGAGVQLSLESAQDFAKFRLLPFDGDSSSTEHGVAFAASACDGSARP